MYTFEQFKLRLVSFALHHHVVFARVHIFNRCHVNLTYFMHICTEYTINLVKCFKRLWITKILIHLIFLLWFYCLLWSDCKYLNKSNLRHCMQYFHYLLFLLPWWFFSKIFSSTNNGAGIFIFYCDVSGNKNWFHGVSNIHVL